uniref:Uncharacterized protein n=1 Tax=Arundo donax TaxID=35708 RepID=A0A0A9DWI8_ARUDO
MTCIKIKPKIVSIFYGTDNLKKETIGAPWHFRMVSMAEVAPKYSKFSISVKNISPRTTATDMGLPYQGKLFVSSHMIR